MTIDGRRYNLSTRSYDANINVTGTGIVGGIVLFGVTLDSPELRSKLVAALAQYRANKKTASEYIQAAVKDGRIDLRRKVEG